MRNKNLISGVRSKNGYTLAEKNEEGVFKTARGKFIVKIKEGFKTVIAAQWDEKELAIASYNQIKGI